MAMIGKFLLLLDLNNTKMLFCFVVVRDIIICHTETSSLCVHMSPRDRFYLLTCVHSMHPHATLSFCKCFDRRGAANNKENNFQGGPLLKRATVRLECVSVDKQIHDF